MLMPNSNLTMIIKYLDEISIIFFFPISLIILYKQKCINHPFVKALLFSLASFVMVGFISGFVNNSSFIISAVGVFDYMKNFMVIIIYFTFFRTRDEFNRIFSLLLFVSIVLGVVAFIQEAWAMGSLYIFKKEISNISNYIFQKEMDIELLQSYWRFGIFRTSSLMVSTINSGLYSLLIFTIYIGINRKVNFAIVAALFSSVFTSVSRIVYTGFILVSGLEIIKGRRWPIILLVPVVTLLILMSNMWDLNVLEFLNKDDMTPVSEIASEKVENISMEIKGKVAAPVLQIETEVQHYREYTREVAVKIWKDYPMLGVGPGMFGGVVSVLFNSHVYAEYNFVQGSYFERLKSIDNFWAQTLAEVGIIGVLAFVGLLSTIAFILNLQRKEAELPELKGLFSGLIVYEIVIILYALGLGLNIPSIMFTYCAFVGISFRCSKQES